MAKRVCFFINYWRGRAGVELQLLLLMQHLDRSRIEPFVVVLHGTAETALENPQESLRCPVVFLQAGGVRSFRTLKILRQFRRLMKLHQIEIIQFLQVDNVWQTLFSFAAFRSGIKAFFGFRVNIGYWITRKQALFGKFLNRFVIKKIIANAVACKKSVIEQEGAKAENVYVVPNLIEIRHFADIPTWTSAGASAVKRIGIVGNLKQIKGTDVFIEAARIVLGKFPDVQFHLAGKGDFERYQSQIDNSGISGSVKLLGAVSDIPAFLATLDIAVLSSRTEGLPNAVMEYMAAGRACIVTNVGGCGELIRNEQNGLLVAADNPPALAAAMCDLLEHTDRAERFAAAARSSINEDYDAENLACRWCEIYEETLR
ncbi:MAG: glycosyltransferase family 4 protein [Planctomycetaceae bacterium]|jgi:glycosyltransferase involved in cell wall biosynthesis|nr:glycosyltransferase family 4 protein [Planctomycetaceae bacterium]